MTEKTFNLLMALKKGKNFKIITNIGEGRGPNGIDSLSFWGSRQWKPEGQSLRSERTTVHGCEDGCVHLTHESTKDTIYYNGAYDYFIPVENIVAIMFVESQNAYITEQRCPSRI